MEILKAIGIFIGVFVAFNVFVPLLIRGEYRKYYTKEELKQNKHKEK